MALRSRSLGVLGIALFGAVGAVAAITRPAGSPLDVLPSIVGAGAGIVALLALLAPLSSAPGRGRRRCGDAAGAGTHADERMVDRLREVLGSGDRKGAALDRRRFFLTSGVALGVAAVAGGGGRLLQRRFDVAEARADLRLPGPASPRPRSRAAPTSPRRSTG